MTLLASLADRDFESDEYGLPISAYSEFDVSGAGLEQGEKRKLLHRAISMLPKLAEHRGYKPISRKNIQLALEFVSHLPFNRLLPKVAVDEDGDILMVWNGPPTFCALTIEQSVLHMVANPGAHSTHVEPTIYNGGRIPPRLLQYIPLR